MIKEIINKYIRNTSGTIAVAFALFVPVLVGTVGMALDYSRAYLVQQRLSQALDAAALAGASSSTRTEDIEQKINDYFLANYPDYKTGVTTDPVVVVDGNEITVTGTALYNTTFLRILGITEIDVDATTTVQRDVQGIEVVLVMDNTGSMSSYNNIQTLRTAATNFVNIMFESASNPEHVRIGLVPYSTSVNIGPYGLGLDMEGSGYGSAFVNNPHGLDYDTGDSDEWHGCVLANDYNDDTTDNAGPWDMYRYCLDDDENVVCDSTTESYNCRGRGRSRTCDYRNVARNGPNYICPATPVTPLSSDQDALLASIGTMRADGHTYGNYGMVWGYRLISPEAPFQEGSQWGSDVWQKAIVMMTDGINTMHPYYSAYGPTADHRIDADDLNDRFAEVCENLKAQDVTIYTVTFTGGVSGSTKDFYRDCATSPSQYFDAPSQDDLINVFETISRELSNLHIKS